MVIDQNTKLSDLLAVAEEHKQYKQDYTGKPTEFRFGEDGRVYGTSTQHTLFGGMPPAGLTEHALRQACVKLGVAYEGVKSLPTDYMLALQAENPKGFAANMNDALDRLPDNKGWMVRQWTENDPLVRAILSTGYLKFDNDTLIKLLSDILEKEHAPHRISRYSYVHPDRMSVDVMFNDVYQPSKGNPDGRYGVGIRLVDDEIGNGNGGAFPVIRVHICDNSITLDTGNLDSSFKFRHFGPATLEVKRVMLAVAMKNILPFTATIIDRMIEAEEDDLPSFSDIVHGMAEKHGWGEAVTDTVFAGSNAQWTKAGLIAGITYAAHQQPNEEQMTDMEFLAGQILFDERGSLIREAEYIHQTHEVRAQRAAARAAARNGEREEE